MTIAVAVTLCACDLNELTNSNKGLSAYEIAVKNGFTGTETDWLNSLHTTNTIEKTTNNYKVAVNTSNDVSTAANIGLKSIVSV